MLFCARIDIGVAAANSANKADVAAGGASIAALVFCLLFIVIGTPWIDKPGIQTDEALFAAGIYPPFDGQFRIRIWNHEYPLMVMSYVGALKSRIWALIFTVWPPSPASLRIPSVFLGALSIWWMYGLVSRTLGTRAALAACALLSTDPIYVLYSRWDHGPVVIQHLCLTGAMLAMVRFHQERRRVWLSAGFFALGLGVWEKAVFTWLMTGLGCAALIVFRRQIRSALSLRNVAVATVAFAIGASPLIAYNVRHPADYVSRQHGVVDRWLHGEGAIVARHGRGQRAVRIDDT